MLNDTSLFRGKSIEREVIRKVLLKHKNDSYLCVIGEADGKHVFSFNLGKYHTVMTRLVIDMLYYLIQDNIDICIGNYQLPREMDGVADGLRRRVFKPEYTILLKLYNNDLNQVLDVVKDSKNVSNTSL